MVGGQQENLCNNFVTNLNIKNKKLICILKLKGKILFDSNSERRLKAFANGCNLDYKIVDKNI